MKKTMPRKPPKKSPRRNNHRCPVCRRLIPDDRSHCTAHSAPFVPATFTTSGNTVEPRLVTPKKSPAKRMKPPTTRIAIIDNNDKQIAILHVAVEIPLVTELPTPTDSHARDEGRKLRKVKRYCEELKSSFDGTIGARDNPSCVIARDILRIIESTPTARGR